MHLKEQWFFGASKKTVDAEKHKVGALQYVDGDPPAMYVAFDNENTVFKIDMSEGILTNKFKMPNHECKSQSRVSSLDTAPPTLVSCVDRSNHDGNQHGVGGVRVRARPRGGGAGARFTTGYLDCEI